MRWTQDQLNAYEARHATKPARSSSSVERESELHERILAECKRRGWLVFHGAMSHRTFRTKGEPDFVILADAGRTILIEAKTCTGKLSTEQQGNVMWAQRLGHTIHVVRSEEEFNRIIK